MIASITRSVQESEAGKRVDQLLTALDEIVSRAQAQRIIKSGNVLLNGNPECAPSKKVRAGQKISVTIPPPKSMKVLPEKGVLDILYEDEHLIVINKAAGVVVHPSAGHASGTLVNFLIHHCQDLSGIGGIMRPGIVHRIDKDTSGILVIAKTDEAHLFLSKQKPGLAGWAEVHFAFTSSYDLFNFLQKYGNPGVPKLSLKCIQK